MCTRLNQTVDGTERCEKIRRDCERKILNTETRLNEIYTLKERIPGEDIATVTKWGEELDGKLSVHEHDIYE